MRILISVAILFFSMLASAQNKLWKGYFSYNSIRAIAAAEPNVFVATENALFMTNTSTSETHLFNTINDFKLDDIHALAYSADYKKLVVGAKNGKVAVIDLGTDQVYILNDIYNKSSLNDNEKIINHIVVEAGYAYLATGYGITTLRLQDQHFGDTYFIGENGEDAFVKDIVIANGQIYANVLNLGIKKASMNSNLLDYANWSMFSFENWFSIINFNNTLVGVKDDLSLNRFVNDQPEVVDHVYGGFLRLTASKNTLTAVTVESVRTYNQELQPTFEYLFQPQTGNFTTALSYNNDLLIGTVANGLFSLKNNTPSTLQNLTPKGALSNQGFRAKVKNNFLWMIFGGYDSNYNPYLMYGPSTFGINRVNLNNATWEELPYANIAPLRATSHIGWNAKEPNTIYIGSYFDGMLKIEAKPQLADSPITHYTSENTGSNGLEKSAEDQSTRVNGPEFDSQGNGWISNSFAQRQIKKFETNNWQSFDIQTLTNSSNQSFTAPVIDKNDTKWLGSYLKGVIAFNEKTNSRASVGNLPSPTINTVAIDQKNQVWIGTIYGLRVVPSADQGMKNGTISSNPIIIMEEGKAQELFYQQPILKIKVDGSNNKWVSIAEAGVFLLSEDGQKTIYRFDSNNSPLPDNNVIDIEINENTGEVFFVTSKGMVSYQHFATAPATNLDQVYVFPNPVRPEFTGEVAISGLTSKAIIKITDVAGNLVYETTAPGGTVLWNTTHFGGQKVKSGVYMIFISSQDGSEKSVKKLMIVR